MKLLFIYIRLFNREDIDITKKLVETGKIMGIDVLDHVIIGDCRHFSMKEAGHI